MGSWFPAGSVFAALKGKIAAARHARENEIPYLGLCLGLQCAVIEFSRSQLGLVGANSAEFDPTCPHPVIDLMESQQDVSDMGGTMRLGIYAAKLHEGSLARTLYGKELIYERHRHRYEVNNRYRKDLEAAGMRLSGTSPDDNLVEIVEIPSHPFFVASQFHPEFKSRPDDPHPLFAGFMAAAARHREGTATGGGPRRPTDRGRRLASSVSRDLRYLGERLIATTSFMEIVRRYYLAPDGRVARREIIRHPGAVAVVPVIDGDVVLISQHRVAIDSDLLEIPAGKCDIPGEDPETTARRECEEEVGYRPKRLTHSTPSTQLRDSPTSPSGCISPKTSNPSSPVRKDSKRSGPRSCVCQSKKHCVGFETVRFWMPRP